MVSWTGSSIHPGVLAAVATVGDALHALVQQRAAAEPPALDPLRGLHLDASDVARLMARPLAAGKAGQADGAAPSPFVLSPEVEESPLGQAATGLGLSPFETAVIALCLLAEIDGRYGPLMGFLHDDVTRKGPSVELALALFAPPGAAGLDYLRAFTPQARLQLWQLVHVSQEDAVIRASLQLERAFLWFLLGAQDLDADVARVAHVLCDGTAEVLPAALEPSPPVLLYGEDEHACLSMAVTASRRVGRSLLVIDGARLAGAEESVGLLGRCLREAVVRGLMPCLTHLTALLPHTSASGDGHWQRLLACPAPVLLVAEGSAGETPFVRKELVPIYVPAPAVAERVAVWREAAAAQRIDADEETLLALAETTTRLSPAAIEEAAAVMAATAAASGEAPQGDHLRQAARTALRQQVQSLVLITPRYTWADIVLPPDRLGLLRHLCSRVRYRSQVREVWGVGGATLPGVTALFAGQPGTGKSMAAEIIAADLGLDLYKIDLAQVVSKYIGETEKNLARIFTEAEQSSIVLVFDEADAIFGKRSDVKDSHDRYANLEISYLLQRMERYRGLAILTTNLRANLDEAFTRRISVSIDFPMPGPADRLRIWQKAFAAAPCDPTLDLQELAERLELTGGAIVNVAVAAAHLAAEEKGVIDHDRLLRAVRWELQKMGRLMGSDTLDALMPAGAGRNGRGN